MIHVQSAIICDVSFRNVIFGLSSDLYALRCSTPFRLSYRAIAAMAPKLQFIGGLVSLLLFLYGWLASWQTMLLSLLSFRFDPQVLVPLVVCVGGLVVTNVRGWKKFKSSGKDTEAFFSAVDMDVPYMVWKHGKAFCQGKPCQDLQDVRQRQAEWRALPLSIATFCLIVPSFVEMPMCFRALWHINLCEASLAGREHLKELRGQFDAMSQSSTRNATLWIAGVQEASNIRSAASGNLLTGLDHLDHCIFSNTCNHAAGLCELSWGWWNSCHCGESLWYFGQAQGNMTMEWILRKGAEKGGQAISDAVVDPKVGSGHLLGFAALVFEFLQSLVPAEKLESHWRSTLRHFRKSPNQFFYFYMEQWRPWQWMLTKGLAILLVASLPIYKKILQKTEATKPKLVQAYIITDLLIQVLTFTFAMGLFPAIMITEEYKYEICYATQHSSVPCPWKLDLPHHGQDLEPWMKAATMTSPLGYLPPFLVSVVLFLTSYYSCLFSGFFKKISVGAVATMTFCSPLHLLVHEKILAAAKRHGTELAMQMVVRTLALASTAIVSWALVGWFGMRVYLAVIFNMKLSPGYVILPILAMYTAHGALGVCTVRAVIQDLMSRRHPPLLAQYGSTEPSLPSESQPQAQAESSTNPPLPPPPGLGLASQGLPPAQPSAMSNAQGLR